MNISKEDLKILHLTRQLLWQSPSKLSPVEIANQLSYIQLDSVSAIARHQDILCFTRSTSYKEEDVWKYLKNKQLFEDWSHGVSLIPIEHLPYYYAERIRRREKNPTWENFRTYDGGMEIDDHIDEILKFIEDNGPVSVKEIETPLEVRDYTWGGSAGRRLMDYLCYRGYIAVTERRNFISYYETAEQVFGDIDFDYPSPIETLKFDIETTLKANGGTPMHRLVHYKYLKGKYEFDGKSRTPRQVITKLIDKGDLYSYKVDGIKDQIVFNKEDFENIDDLVHEDDEKQVILLSPWDSAMITRESLLEQYNFDYKMEVYVPEKKRKYGYYVMPILWGTEFIGRVDVKFDRSSNTMNFNRWFWEDGFTLNSEFLENLIVFLQRFLKFHKAENYDLGNLTKNKIKIRL